MVWYCAEISCLEYINISRLFVCTSRTRGYSTNWIRRPQTLHKTSSSVALEQNWTHGLIGACCGIYGGFLLNRIFKALRLMPLPILTVSMSHCVYFKPWEDFYEFFTPKADSIGYHTFMISDVTNNFWIKTVETFILKEVKWDILLTSIYIYLFNYWRLHKQQF